MPTKMRFMDFFQRVSSAAVSWDGNFGAVLLSVDSHVFVMFFCSRSSISFTSSYFPFASFRGNDAKNWYSMIVAKKHGGFYGIAKT